MDKLVECFAMAVCRESGKVLDAKGYEWPWDLDALMERHDLTKVDIVLRRGLRTMPEAAPVETEYPRETPEPPIVDNTEKEDVPF